MKAKLVLLQTGPLLVTHEVDVSECTVWTYIGNDEPIVPVVNHLPKSWWDGLHDRENYYAVMAGAFHLEDVDTDMFDLREEKYNFDEVVDIVNAMIKHGSPDMLDGVNDVTHFIGEAVQRVRPAKIVDVEVEGFIKGKFRLK